MVPPTSGYGWGAQQGAVADTIDLTNSSPEPERQPRLPPTQQQLSNYFKKEPRADLGGSTRVRSGRNATEMNDRGSRQPVRQIHPQHMAKLVDSTNPQVLRNVVLELCKISPALSGSIARGIAPYSTFAKALIIQHGHDQSASTSRPVKTERHDDDDAYEYMKQRLAGPQKKGEQSLNRAQSSSNVASAHRPQHAGTQSVSGLKRAPPPDMDDSDSDLDSYIPTAFTPSVPRHQRLPLRDTSTSSTPIREPTFRTPNFTGRSARPARVQERPKVKAELESCTLCHKPIEDEAESCWYHPSSKIADDGTTVCDSCSEPLEEMGCVIGMHVSESEAQLQQSHAGRSDSPSKRPRIS